MESRCCSVFLVPNCPTRRPLQALTGSAAPAADAPAPKEPEIKPAGFSFASLALAGGAKATDAKPASTSPFSFAPPAASTAAPAATGGGSTGSSSMGFGGFGGGADKPTESSTSTGFGGLSLLSGAATPTSPFQLSKPEVRRHPEHYRADFACPQPAHVGAGLFWRLVRWVRAAVPADGSFWFWSLSRWLRVQAIFGCICTAP